MDHVNKQPRESHNTDFSRVQSWALNGWTKYYRQNLIFSAYPVVDISALANKICCNYAGSVRTNNPIAVGTISQVVVTVPQVGFMTMFSVFRVESNTFYNLVLTQSIHLDFL